MGQNMKTSTKFLVMVAFTIYIAQTSATTDKVVCYLGSWATYRPGNGRFTIEDIDASLCTHLIYSFVGINTDGSIRILDEWNEISLRALERFNNLKQQHPKLKTLIAIGGWNEGSIKFSTVAASPYLRAVFIADAISFMYTYGFDGFDLDWEYPAQRGGISADKANFAILLKEFRAQIEASGKEFLLTAAVAATSTAADISYDVPALSQYLDFINIMAYDFHGSYDGRTGQNAPLYASNLDVSVGDKQKNVENSINSWISRGANPEKLILGMGVYGRSFTLASAWNNKLGDPAPNPGNKGPYTAEAGMLGYNEICEMQKDGTWTEVWDDVQKVPYTYKGNQWVGYDNERSIKLKVEFAKSMNLGGVMIWSIETDDFLGVCGPKYPILSAINEAMESNNPGSGSSGSTSASTTASSGSSGSTSGSTTAKSTTTAKITTSTSSNIGAVCTSAGFMRDPVVCSRFYQCVANLNTLKKYEFNCSGVLVFDTSLNICNYPQLVDC